MLILVCAWHYCVGNTRYLVIRWETLIAIQHAESAHT